MLCWILGPFVFLATVALGLSIFYLVGFVLDKYIPEKANFIIDGYRYMDRTGIFLLGLVSVLAVSTAVICCYAILLAGHQMTCWIIH